MQHGELCALPWPWRACRGGAVKADDGTFVTTTSDRRAARALVRETEAFLRSAGLLRQAAVQMFDLDQRIDARWIVDSGRGAMTTAQIAETLNATQGHVGTFKAVGDNAIHGQLTGRIQGVRFSFKIEP